MYRLPKKIRRRSIIRLTAIASTGLLAAACGGGSGSDNDSQTSVCPTFIRGLNANNPNTASPVDIEVNGTVRFSNISFRGVTNYISVPPGLITVRFLQAGTTTVVPGGERKFSANSNLGYTVAATGSVPGPEGQLLFNVSPFVYPDDLTPPNPNKFKGKFYRDSETSLIIDFRIYDATAPSVDISRIRNLIPKTAIPYPEITAGSYIFDPVGEGSFATLINPALIPPAPVQVRANVPAGTIFDVIATGNGFGTGPNSLQLVSASTRTAIDASGCITVQ